jgi:DNA-binding response OmpR family regulator
MARNDEVSVLVVDDSAELSEVIGLALKSRGYVVRTATDGAIALAMIARSLPHCIILDVRMPNMDGYEFARHLRAQYRDDIVLIAISGHAPTEPQVLATFSIVDHYLQKPIDLGELDKILPALTEQ